MFSKSDPSENIYYYFDIFYLNIENKNLGQSPESVGILDTWLAKMPRMM